MQVPEADRTLTNGAQRLEQARSSLREAVGFSPVEKNTLSVQEAIGALLQKSLPSPESQAQLHQQLQTRGIDVREDGSVHITARQLQGASDLRHEYFRGARRVVIDEGKMRGVFEWWDGRLRRTVPLGEFREQDDGLLSASTQEKRASMVDDRFGVGNNFDTERAVKALAEEAPNSVSSDSIYAVVQAQLRQRGITVRGKEIALYAEDAQNLMGTLSSFDRIIILGSCEGHPGLERKRGVYTWAENAGKRVLKKTASLASAPTMEVPVPKDRFEAAATIEMASVVDQAPTVELDRHEIEAPPAELPPESSAQEVLVQQEEQIGSQQVQIETLQAEANVLAEENQALSAQNETLLQRTAELTEENKKLRQQLRTQLANLLEDFQSKKDELRDLQEPQGFGKKLWRRIKPTSWKAADQARITELEGEIVTQFGIISALQEDFRDTFNDPAQALGVPELREISVEV